MIEYLNETVETLQDEAGQTQVDVSTGLDKLVAELKKRREGIDNKDNIKIQADR